MAIIKGNSQNFNELISQEFVLVDFYADWCGPCKMLGPILESLEGINIVKINVDEEAEIAKKFGIMSIPSLLLFKQGNLIDTKVGFLNKEQLDSWLKTKC